MAIGRGFSKGIAGGSRGGALGHKGARSLTQLAWPLQAAKKRARTVTQGVGAVIKKARDSFAVAVGSRDNKLLFEVGGGHGESGFEGLHCSSIPARDRMCWSNKRKAVMPQANIDQELCEAAEKGDVGKVLELLAHGANPGSKDSLALGLAAASGSEECVKLLLPVSDAKAEESLALRWAAENGHVECVKALLPVSDPKARSSGALRWAAVKGRVECVRLLLPVSEVNARESLALRLAAEYGHMECVKLLIPESDPKANGSDALRRAASYGNSSCVRLLLATSQPLIEIEGLLDKVIEAGRAETAALLIEEEPRLLDGLNLSQCLALAIENEHGDLARFLSSIIDQREILGVVPDRASSHGVARI